MFDQLFANTDNTRTGQLGNIDFFEELTTDDCMEIYTHRDSLMKSNRNIHPSSIDITPSIVAMSVKTGMLEQVYINNREYTNRYYLYIKPRDTVLVVSNEFFFLTDYITGYVTSCVSNSVNGLIETTSIVDPNWMGGLAIRLTNPTNKAVKLEVGIATHYNEGAEPEFIYDTKPIASISFHYLSRVCFAETNTYKNMRTDLFEEVCYKNKRGIKALFRKVFYRKRRKYTDFFMEYINTHQEELITRKGWDEFLENFSSVAVPTAERSRKTVTTYDFLKKENMLRKIF